jgi:predicted  nucleic acid-binding Zn-ribbon protein
VQGLPEQRRRRAGVAEVRRANEELRVANDELAARNADLKALLQFAGGLAARAHDRGELTAYAEQALSAVTQRLAEAGERRAAAERRRDEAYAEMDKELEFRTSARTPLAADLPAELVALYDKIRAETGLGAALVRSGRCGGCRIELYGADLARVKSAPADEVVRCEECRRIMVRTEESGL